MMEVIRRTILVSLLLLLVASLSSAETPADSLTALYRKNANKAARYSAILPGAGQVYNHKYWKVPIVIAGFATLYYVADFNNDYYKEFKSAYIYRSDGDPSTTDNYPSLTSDDLRVRKDYYRRNRDLCYVLMGGFYILNIVDAYVDAQLKDFDVSDKLSLKIQPGLLLSEQHTVGGLKLTFSLH
jgi:hypothetical protein